MRISRKN